MNNTKYTKTIELNTSLVRLWSGTYNTIWDVEVPELDEREHGKQLYAMYSQDDLIKSIISEYKEFTSEIVEELEIPWIKKIVFTGDFYKPREYNFKTDSIDFELTINEREMFKHLYSLDDSDDFNQYLKDNYSSYDGFISFTPNNYNDLVSSLENDDNYHRSVSAFINYLIYSNVDSLILDVEHKIYESWSSNGYRGLDYKALCYECDQEVKNFNSRHTCSS